MYLEDHIPGASFVDVERELSVLQPAGTVGGRRPLPSSEAFAEVAGRVGIGEGVIVGLRPGDDRGRAVVWLSVISGTTTSRCWTAVSVRAARAAAGRGGGDRGGSLRRRASGSKTRSARRSEARLGDDGLVVAGRAPRSDTAATSSARRPGRPHPGAQSAVHRRRRDARRAPERAEELVVYCGSGVTACVDLLGSPAPVVRRQALPGLLERLVRPRPSRRTR